MVLGMDAHILKNETDPETHGVTKRSKKGPSYFELVGGEQPLGENASAGWCFREQPAFVDSRNVKETLPRRSLIMD